MIKSIPSIAISKLVLVFASLTAAGASLAQGQAVQPAGPASAAAAAATPRPTPRAIDRIVAVVNDEVVTANELRTRARMAEAQLRRQKIQPPAADVLERQVLERMIVDRAQLQLARETGVRVDDATVNATLGRIAESNGLSVQVLRQRLEADGISFTQFRDDIRQDIILNRLREREVDSRVQISDSELENFIAAQAGVMADSEEINLAQILLRVPENSASDRIEATRNRADELMAQLKGGADFARIAASFSNAPEALQGGELGWRNADRLPTLFIDAVKGLKQGDTTSVIRSPNGFHILKVLGRRSGVDSKLALGPVQQTRARHILLRVSDLTPEPEVKRRLDEMKQRVEAGQIEFGTLARLHSLDPSGSRGGDLGWLYPGDTVPEFEEAVAKLQINELSEPIKTRFGWHLIEILERRSHVTTDEVKRTQCARQIRATKAEEERELWVRRLRDQAFVDIRR